MCVIEDLQNECLSTTNILRYIDDYSIYSYYIGLELELNARYSSPLRTGDDNPSFCLFKGKEDRIFFKDHATTFKGDVFQFVRILMSDDQLVPFEHVLKRIDRDFHLGLYMEDGESSKLPLKRNINTIPQKEKYSIQITSNKSPNKLFKDFWNKYDISKKTLELYNCTQVAVIHYKSKTTSHSFQINPKGLCIAYQIGGRYKLYNPYEDKKNKFQNDFPINWIEGLLQLKYTNDFCIITKAMKEVMFFREHFDWDTVAGKSENTMIPDHLMKRLFNKFNRVYIWLDSDEAGIKAQAKYIEKYSNLIPIVTNWENKDVTDQYNAYKQTGRGIEKQVLEQIKQLIL